jgi:hypothetical protein
MPAKEVKDVKPIYIDRIDARGNRLTPDEPVY